MESNNGAHYAPRGHRKEGAMKSRMVIIASTIAVVVVVFIVTVFALYSSSVSSKIDDSKYQAVFLTNGQVYFGKLQSVSGGYLKLSDIYYLQSSDESSDTLQDSTSSSSGSDVQLVKLGEELHGPEDEMVINKDEVLFFENLKSDGKVTKAIDQFNEK